MNKSNNPYAQYKQISVETASPAQLLIMLYDGAIKFLHQSIEAIESKDIEKANLYLWKTMEIIQELVISLDMKIEISQNLYDLYDYYYRRLMEANLKKDRAIAEEVLQFMQELRDAWAQAAITVKSGEKAENSINMQG